MSSSRHDSVTEAPRAPDGTRGWTFVSVLLILAGVALFCAGCGDGGDSRGKHFNDRGEFDRIFAAGS